jgi:CDP-glucose 4,6-dehydratase
VVVRDTTVEGLGMTSSFWTDRPTLVTGATGLVGSAVVSALLDRGANVTVLIRDRVPHSRLQTDGMISLVNVVDGDVEDQVLLERLLGEYEIDTVFHLAAQAIVGVANVHPVATFRTNIGGTWATLEACRRSPRVKQIVIASSDKAYGDHASAVCDETTPLQARFPYDVSKACADMIAQSYASAFHLPVAVTRCGNFYGGGDLNWSRLVPGTIRSVLRGERPVIRSDGHYVRDYFYVEDGAAAYLLLAEQLAARPELRGEAFNFSYDANLSVLDLVGTILRLMGSTLMPIVRNGATGEIPVQRLDATKARTRLGWQPACTLDEGLRRTIDWYERFLRDGRTGHVGP